MRIYLVILLALSWILLVVVEAKGEEFAYIRETRESEAIVADVAYVTALNSPHVDKFDLTATPGAQCVEFVQRNGFADYRGNANIWIRYINSQSPSVGAVVVTNEGYGSIGHLALVTHVGVDGIEVYEQNYAGPGIVTHRMLDRSVVIGYVRR